jgi:hypothetical protein
MQLSRLLKSFSLVAVLAAPSALAHASSISYNLVNVNSAAGPLSGTVSIDTTSGLVTSTAISLDDPSGGFPIFNTVASSEVSNGIGQSFLSGPSTSPHNFGAQFALYFDTSNLGGGDLTICIAGGACGPGSYTQISLTSGHDGPFYLTSGELDPSTPAATSEPSTLLLLGTGIVGGAALMARMASRRDVQDLA